MRPGIGIIFRFILKEGFIEDSAVVHMILIDSEGDAHREGQARPAVTAHQGTQRQHADLDEREEGERR